jgi:hypothetical protein
MASFGQHSRHFEEYTSGGGQESLLSIPARRLGIPGGVSVGFVVESLLSIPARRLGIPGGVSVGFVVGASNEVLRAVGNRSEGSSSLANFALTTLFAMYADQTAMAKSLGVALMGMIVLVGDNVFLLAALAICHPVLSFASTKSMRSSSVLFSLSIIATDTPPALLNAVRIT